MYHEFFKQELLEVLLECLTDLNPNDVSSYDKFCDRLEKGMNPHIETDQESSIDAINATNPSIELKIPYLTNLIEEERRRSNLQQNEHQDLAVNSDYRDQYGKQVKNASANKSVPFGNIIP